MSSQEASPANRSASPENGSERRTSATCGRKCLEQYARFVPPGSWARTFSGLLIGRTDWYSSRCALTWKMRGTLYNRLYFRLAPSTPRIAGTEYGLLPTVVTQGLITHGANGSEPIALTILPTPTASCGKTGTYMPGKSRNAERMRMGALNNYVARQVGKNSRLSPQFVAEMMGFPPDWTALPFRPGADNPSKPTEML